MRLEARCVAARCASGRAPRREARVMLGRCPSRPSVQALRRKPAARRRLTAEMTFRNGSMQEIPISGWVGKTHLAVSLAITAAEAGRRVNYGTLAGLIELLTDAKAAGNCRAGCACSPNRRSWWSTRSATCRSAHNAECRSQWLRRRADSETDTGDSGSDLLVPYTTMPGHGRGPRITSSLHIAWGSMLCCVPASRKVQIPMTR